MPCDSACHTGEMGLIKSVSDCAISVLRHVRLCTVSGQPVHSAFRLVGCVVATVTSRGFGRKFPTQAVFGCQNSNAGIRLHSIFAWVVTVSDRAIRVINCCCDLRDVARVCHNLHGSHRLSG